MKFQKDLQSSTYPEWEAHYIGYKRLKLILKSAVEKGADTEGDSEFFTALEEELEKVNRFYVETVQKYEKQIEDLVPKDAGQSLLSSPVLANPTPTENPDAMSLGKPAIEPTAATDRLNLVHRQLGKLQSYVWINNQGFSKIMKKYDKRRNLRGTGDEKAPAFDTRLEKEVFRSERLDSVIAMNKIAKKKLASSDDLQKESLSEMKLISGSANKLLSQEIASRIGVPLTNILADKFNDGEVRVQINESVRGCDVFIIQPTCSPVNDNLMELLLLVSAARRASAYRVTAIVPYYGYARQDRKDRARVPISAADVARMLEAMGVDRVVCVDLHCAQIQGFFGPRTPVDNLYASPIAWEFFKTRDLNNPVIVSPDAGGVARVKLFRDGMSSLGVDTTMAVIIKQRSKPGEVGSTDLVGSVKGCDCIIVDDMIDTAGTLCAAAKELRNFGAEKIFAFASHGLFNGPGAQRIEDSVMDLVIVANTIPLEPRVIETTKKIRQVSVGKLLAYAIMCVHTGKSVSNLFDTEAGESLLA